jgi:hypothetical protein
MGRLSAPASGEALPMEQEFKQGYRMHRILSNFNRLDVDDDTERSKHEFEAEAVAYVVGSYCGLDTSRSAFT